MTIDNPVWDKDIETAGIMKSMISEMSSIENVAVQELERLQEHADLLIKQAHAIQSRVELTKRINNITIPFRVVSERKYYLYADDVLSLISPDEWSKDAVECICVRRLGDGSWEEVPI
tara:strand:+ start:85 stop:438 length:354 start_codon:yes stop_codon:yes gene_type:complete